MSPKFMLIYFAVPLENGPPKIMPSPLKASAAVIIGDAAAMISITIKPTKTSKKNLKTLTESSSPAASAQEALRA